MILFALPRWCCHFLNMYKYISSNAFDSKHFFDWIVLYLCMINVVSVTKWKSISFSEVYEIQYVQLLPARFLPYQRDLGCYINIPCQ